jgi:Ca2+/Na+ antiporter
MKIAFLLEKEALVNMNLYRIAQSESILKTRKTAQIIVTALPIFVAIYFYVYGNMTIVLLSLLFSVAAYILYPLRDARFYKKKITANVIQANQDKFEQQITLTFDEQYLSSEINGNEGKVELSEIEQIDEIQNEIFIKTKTGQSIFIPKNGVSNISDFIPFLKKLSTTLNIPYLVDLDWKYK